MCIKNILQLSRYVEEGHKINYHNSLDYIKPIQTAIISVNKHIVHKKIKAQHTRNYNKVLIFQNNRNIFIIPPNLNILPPTLIN